jgi:hypothetical protein
MNRNARSEERLPWRICLLDSFRMFSASCAAASSQMSLVCMIGGQHRAAPPPGARARARRTGKASPPPPGRRAAQGHPNRPLSAALSRTRLKKAALLGKLRHSPLRGTWERAADAGAHARPRKDDSSQEERQARQTTTRQSTDSRLMTTVSPSPSWPFQALRPSSISTLLWPFGTWV